MFLEMLISFLEMVDCILEKVNFILENYIQSISKQHNLVRGRAHGIQLTKNCKYNYQEIHLQRKTKYKYTEIHVQLHSDIFFSEYFKATQPGSQQGTWDTTDKNIQIQLQKKLIQRNTKKHKYKDMKIH